MLPDSPFREDRGYWATLDSTQSITMPMLDESVCAHYRRDGLALLYDRHIPLAQFVEELRAVHEGHWEIGTRCLGWRGVGYDVSRTHHLTEGEDPLTNGHG